MATAVGNETSEQTVKDNSKQNVKTKKCELCDNLLQAEESFCRRCGALWIASDCNLSTKLIRIFDPQDYTQYSMIPPLITA